MFGTYSFSGAALSALPYAIFTATVSENVSVVDTPDAYKVYVESFSEGFYPSDSSVATLLAVAAISENFNSVEIAVVGSGYLESLVESFSIADANVSAKQTTDSITENLFSAYSSLEGEAYYASLVENFAPADSSIVNIGYVVFPSHGVAANDVRSVTAQFQTSRSENVSVADIRVAITSYLISVNENTGETAYANVTAAFAAQRVEAVEVTDLISYFHYPVSVGWSSVDTDIYNYSASNLMFGAASFAQIPFSGNTGGESIVTPNWAVGSNCAYETVPVYTYIPINPEGAIFGGGTFGAFTFGGFSGLYNVITTYNRIGPVNTNVVWTDINNESYTTVGTTVAVFGGVPMSGVAISSSVGGTVIVTPNWKDIINS